MNIRDIENTHKLLIENNVQRQRPEMILRQVNMLKEYIEDIQMGSFRGPKIEEIDALDDLLYGVAYLMGFEKPKDQGHYADYLLHSDPRLKVEANEGESK
tara:strand:+ start:194 stop:493 length:300 start_codon:yes stop_codon:yes gene_type:complete